MRGEALQSKVPRSYSDHVIKRTASYVRGTSIVRARDIARRTPQRNGNPTTSLNTLFSHNKLAKKTWIIYSCIPSHNAL